MKKVLKALSNIGIVIILIFSIIMTVMVLTSAKSEIGIPNLAGKAIFNVETDSMDGPEGFPVGSLIIVDILEKEEARNLKVGDVITFRAHYEDVKFLDTHRIIEVIDKNGEIYYRTQGDNEETFDAEAAYSGNVVALWSGTAIPKLGSVMIFLQSQLGFMLCVVVPTAIFFFFELFKFISVLMENKKEKALEAVKNAEDEIKQKVVAEMLAKQEAEKAATEKKPEVPAAPAAESEEDIRKRAVEEYIAQQEAAKAAAAREEEIKKQAIAEYLAQQEAEKK